MNLPNLPKLGLPPFAPAARRKLRAFGADAELVLVPERAGRQNRADVARPAFAACRGEQIVRDETCWQEQDLALTPNRHPFAEHQGILWQQQRGRTPTAELLAVAFALSESGGTAMMNTVGAAASIARAHVHVTVEALPFLGAMRRVPLDASWLPRLPGVSYVQLDVPFCALGVVGAAIARAAATVELDRIRLTSAVNLVAMGDTTWVFPRRVETPAPHFGHALGCAEYWGRWCYTEREPFERATGEQLEQALLAASMPRL